MPSSHRYSLLKHLLVAPVLSPKTEDIVLRICQQIDKGSNRVRERLKVKAEKNRIWPRKNRPMLLFFGAIIIGVQLHAVAFDEDSQRD